MASSGSAVSKRAIGVAASATLAITSQASALRAAGHPVIGFGAGEPDFPTPDYIVDAARIAVDDPATHRYSPAAGLPPLRAAVAAAMARTSGYVVDPSEVVVTNGGKQAVYLALQVLLDPGDEVLLPAPYWVTYPEAVRRDGAEHVRPQPGHGRAAQCCDDRSHEGSDLRIAVESIRRRLLPRADG